MKVSVSLPDEDIQFLDSYAKPGSTDWPGRLVCKALERPWMGWIGREGGAGRRGPVAGPCELRAFGVGGLSSTRPPRASVLRGGQVTSTTARSVACIWLNEAAQGQPEGRCRFGLRPEVVSRPGRSMSRVR